MKMKALAPCLLFVIVSQAEINAQSFSPTSFFDIHAFHSSKLSVGDYNKDGIDDLLVSGTQWNYSSLVVFTIEQGVVKKHTVNGLPTGAQNAEWIDFDGDSDLDVFATISDDRHISAGFYVNVNGNFSLLKIDIPNFKNVRFSVVDYDGDADTDVLVAGGEEYDKTNKTILLRNTGGTFQSVPTILEASYLSDIVWADFDKDNDLDVVISHHKLNGYSTTYHRNDGNNVFTRLSKSLPAGNHIMAGDFDNDADVDLLGSEPFTIMVNDGSGNFAPIPGFILTGSGKNKWADYDLDGDLDLFHYEWENGVGVLKLYTFKDNSYTQMQNTGLPGTDTYAFYDCDRDADLDLIALADFLSARIYRNNLGTNPYPLDRRPSGVVDFELQPIDESSIRVQYQQFNREAITGIKIEMKSGSGNFYEVATGRYNYTTEVITGLQQGVEYSFRLRVENAFGFSDYTPVMRSRTVSAEFEKSPALPYMYQTLSSSLADLDNDGDVDLIYSGYDGNNEKTYVMRNNNGTFVTQTNNLPVIAFHDIDAADYDHDGDMDLLMSGTPEDALLARTIIAVNNGGFDFTIHSQELKGVRSSFSRWVEINGDGYPDIYLSGTRDGENTQHLNQVLINQKNGTFIEIATHGLPSMFQSDMDAADFNNDGKIDIAVAGFKDTASYHLPVAEIYFNRGDNTFEFSQNLGKSADSSIESADLDGDGDIDLVVSMFNTPLRIYKNDQGIFTEDTRNKLFKSNEGHIVLGDLDNDGDTDILYGGRGSLVYKTVVYLNDGTGLFTDGYYPLEPYTSFVDYSLGDVDNDGDLDIFESGSAYQNRSVHILKNETPAHNSAPAPPSIVKKQQVPGGFYLLTERGSDDRTDSKSLSQNVYVKNQGGEFLFNSHSDNTTGKLKRAVNGNMSLNDSIVIENLSPGTYTVGVQNIDNSYVASAFITTTVQVDLTAPVLLTKATACAGETAEIKVQGYQVRWFKDASLTQSAGSGNVLRLAAGNADTTFYAVQQHEETYGPSLEVRVTVDPSITGSITQSGIDLVAPAATTYQWFRNDSLLPGMNDQKIEATAPGVYRVKATRGACATALSFTLRPLAPEVSGPDEACIGQSITIQAAGENLTWYDEGILVRTGDTFEYEILSDADTSISVSQTVSAVESPATRATWKVFEYPGSTLTFENNSLIAPHAQHYQWYKDGDVLDDKIGQQLELTGSGVYFCRVSNSQCETDTESMSVILTSTDLEENLAFSYHVQGDRLTISLKQECDFVTIYDLTGKVILEDTNPLREENSYSTNVASLRSGMYILVVNGSLRYRGKFIKPNQ